MFKVDVRGEAADAFGQLDAEERSAILDRLIALARAADILPDGGAFRTEVGRFRLLCEVLCDEKVLALVAIEEKTRTGWATRA